MTPHLELRNQLSDWLLEALDGSGEGGTIRALAEFAREADENGVATGLSPQTVETLGSAVDIFRADGDTICLSEQHRAGLEYLRRRAVRFEETLRRFDPAEHEDQPERALRAGVILFELELFFEFHEVLESVWRRSAEPLRTFLQGLIQVAVGFHHEQRGNFRGADSLLRDGLEKLRPFRPEAWGVELEHFCTAVEEYRQRHVVEPSTLDHERGKAERPKLVIRPSPHSST